MSSPDFAHTDLRRLEAGDLRFLIEHFPHPGRSYDEIASVLAEFPSTLESVLESDYVLDRLLRHQSILAGVSPFLLFNVLLRRTLSGGRTPLDRKVINYLANLLTLFVRVDRLLRAQTHDKEAREYIVEMLQEATRADGSRRFIVHTHIGNYALFLTGMFPRWIEHRHQIKRRPVARSFYEEQGPTYYHQAAMHPLAEAYELRDVFLRLALMFDHYSGSLNKMAQRYLLH